MGSYQYMRHEERKALAKIAAKKAKKENKKNSNGNLNLKSEVNAGRLTAKAAMNKLAGVPGGRDTNTWTWLQRKMSEK